MSLAKLIAARMLGQKKKPVGEATRSQRAQRGAEATRGAPAAETGSKLARASGDQPRHLTPRVLPEPDLVAGLSTLPLPPPTPDLPPAVIAKGWVGSCKAVDAETGRRCRLPAHPGEAHRHERGPFFRIATPSQTHFPHRAAVDAAATRHSNPNETP